MIRWRDRINRANEGRFWRRGFSVCDRYRAGDWTTCAVGEQIALGRAMPFVYAHDLHMRRLGFEFLQAVSLWSRIFGRVGIRRAERLLTEIENYALELERGRRTSGGKEDQEA